MRITVKLLLDRLVEFPPDFDVVVCHNDAQKAVELRDVVIDLLHTQHGTFIPEEEYSVEGYQDVVVIRTGVQERETGGPLAH